MNETSNSLHGTLDQLLLTLSVNVTAIAVCEVDEAWRMIVDPMDNPVIHYVLHGAGYLRVDDDQVELKKDSFVIVPGGTTHYLETQIAPQQEKHGLADCAAIGDGMLRMRAGRERKLITTCGAVSATYGDTLGFFDHLQKPAVVESRYAETVRQSFGNIHKELANPIVGTRAITSALMKQCIVLMVRSELNRTTGSHSWLWTLRDERLAKVIATMLDRPSEDYTVDHLAKIAAMSRSAFSKRFSESFGISPIDFLTIVRLSQAAHLLARTQLPINVIAHSIGYTSRSYFSRTFRAHYGADPTSFRKRHGNAPNEQSWRPLRALRTLFGDSE